MQYVDGFVVPVPKKKLTAYRRLAQRAAKVWRDHGVGYALLDKAIAICKAHHIEKISLSSQTHAIAFYQKAGFVVTSEA